MQNNPEKQTPQVVAQAHNKSSIPYSKQNRITRNLAASAAVCVALSGCGGDERGSRTNDFVTGRIADGYLRGAIVFWDCNDNYKVDADELSTISGTAGVYELPIQPDSACKLSADVPSTAVDEDTGERVSAPMFMRATPDNSKFISPLTTVVALGVVSETALKDRFGEGNTLQINADYIAAGSEGVPHHNAARFVAAALQSSYGLFTSEDSEAKDRIRGALSIVPQTAFTSTQLIPLASVKEYAAELSTQDDVIRLSSDTQRFVVNEIKYKDLNPTQKGHVDFAKKIYDDNWRLMEQGENLEWSHLSLSTRQALKARFASEDFTDPQEVIDLISERNMFLQGERSKIKEALAKFDSDLTSVLIDGILDTSFTYFDGVISIVGPIRVSTAGAKLIGPQKSNKIRKLRASINNFQSGLGCLGANATLLNSMVSNLDTNQFIEAEKLWGLAECLFNEIKSEKHKIALKRINAAIKGKKVLDSADRQALDSIIALAEFGLVTLDLVGSDKIPAMSKAVGPIKVVLSAAKAFKLYSDIGNTNDAAQLSFEKALADIDKRVDDYLDEYAEEAFDLRLKPYFKYQPPFEIEVSTTHPSPLETPVNVSLSKAPYIKFPTDIQWFFGDGATGTGTNVSYIYALPGTYKLTGYIKSPNLELATKVYEATIEVTCAEKQEFSNAEGCFSPTGADGTPLLTKGDFRDEFNGQALDNGKWTSAGYGYEVNANTSLVGSYTMGNGVIDLGYAGGVTTFGKQHFKGHKIVVEARVARTGAGEFPIALVNTQDLKDRITISDTGYCGAGFLGGVAGRFQFSKKYPFCYGESGYGFSLGKPAAVGEWMEYRLTVEGTKFTMERGPTLDNITQSATETMNLPIDPYEWFLYFRTGSSGGYYGAKFDWIRVNVTPSEP